MYLILVIGLTKDLQVEEERAAIYQLALEMTVRTSKKQRRTQALSSTRSLNASYVSAKLKMLSYVLNAPNSLAKIA